MALRIGILGAARIADDGVVEPARALGHEVVAVAARDRSRAEVFAYERGIRHVHDGYADVIADPDVDLVYNALVNSLHTKWNLSALTAGKDVLSEKPLASNAAEAASIRQTARATGRTLVEGFHYLHHPVSQRLHELVTSGALGHVERVEVVLEMAAPPDSDPRWSLELGGGATMDLGCYVVHAARQVGAWTSGEPRLVRAEATLKAPEVDAGMAVELRYPEGVVADCRWDMAATGRTMTWTIVGTKATATSVAFAVPHRDPRLLVLRDGQTTAETLSGQTSYTYQLDALANTLAHGASFLVDLDDSVANAELIDQCYRSAGLSPRI